MPPTRCRPRDVELESMQWCPEDATKSGEVLAWLERHGLDARTDVWSGGEIIVEWDEDSGNGFALPHGQVIRGVTGEFFGITAEQYQRDYLEVSA